MRWGVVHSATYPTENPGDEDLKAEGQGDHAKGDLKQN